MVLFVKASFVHYSKVVVCLDVDVILISSIWICLFWH